MAGLDVHGSERLCRVSGLGGFALTKEICKLERRGEWQGEARCTGNIPATEQFSSGPGERVKEGRQGKPVSIARRREFECLILMDPLTKGAGVCERRAAASSISLYDLSLLKTQ